MNTVWNQASLLNTKLRETSLVFWEVDLKWVCLWCLGDMNALKLKKNMQIHVVWGICSVFLLYLVALWVFAAHLLSNWICFFVFSRRSFCCNKNILKNGDNIAKLFNQNTVISVNLHSLHWTIVYRFKYSRALKQESFWLAGDVFNR